VRPAAKKGAPAKAKAKAKPKASPRKKPVTAPPPASPPVPDAAAAVAAAPESALAPAPEPAPVSPAATASAPPADLLPEIPFHELSRDAASAFVYAALTPDEVLALVKQLGLTTRGFRPEALGEVERCDLLGDDLRAGPEARQPVQALLRKVLEEPAFAGSRLDAAAAEELLEVAGSDHGLAIALWRLLADPQPEVRARGAAALDRLAAEWYGPGPAGEGQAGPPDGPPAHASGRGGAAASGADAGKVRALEEKLARAEAQAESHRLRGEERAEKLQGQVKEARAEAARAVEEAARARQAAEAARGAQGQAEAALAAARGSDAAAEAARLRTALREAEVRLHAAEGRGGRAEERLAEAEASLAAARAQAAAGSAPAPAASDPQDGEPEEVPGTWLLPVFTPEFYDSMQGWDRRIQRAALKQAFLLSQDWRHPSLRALALEGLPGYYRVRVATDVRLIYRRGERQDAVEICSLIDREDLDRYVRQAKTR
jgi:mRNA-degrading endonuclease RelE of RelBE toxin-antitoxin system